MGALLKTKDYLTKIMIRRLSKAMAAAGVGSRRACEELVFAGRVTVNGKRVLLPQVAVDLAVDQVVVDSSRIVADEAKVYYLLNKPVGYICSHVKADPRDKLVLDLIPREGNRLFTLGRLDKNTGGLLVVTNDGAFANRVMHPSNCVQKEYLVKTRSEVTGRHLQKIQAGTYVEGSFVKPVSVKKVRKGTLKIAVVDGKKREVRLMVKAAALEVFELTRIRIGGLTLGKLPLATYRELSLGDLKLLLK